MPTAHQGYTANYSDWGGDYWRVAHCVTFLYSEDNPSDGEKTVVRDFFAVFPYLLPCGMCGEHFLTETQTTPLTQDVLLSRNNLTRWLHAIHNRVNVRVGKPEIPYDDVFRYFLVDSRANLLPRTRPPLPPATGGALLSMRRALDEETAMSGGILGVLPWLLLGFVVGSCTIAAVVLARKKQSSSRSV